MAALDGGWYNNNIIRISLAMYDEDRPRSFLIDTVWSLGIVDKVLFDHKREEYKHGRKAEVCFIRMAKKNLPDSPIVEHA